MELMYTSTRNANEKVTASQAILKGLAEDGGLFVPEQLPTLDKTVDELAGMTYQETVDGDGGCPFYGRCRYAGENCLSEMPTLTDIGTPGHPHLVRCERIAYGEKYTAAD